MSMSTRLRPITFCALLAIIAGPTYAKPGRAVSLNALAAAMKSGQMTAQAESLCGITRVTGYVIDKKSRDIVLVGAVDASLPALHLDDFVVAMRNAWIIYGKTIGRVRYYSDPGCSIDPDPRVLGRLRDLQSVPVDFSSESSMQAAADRWHEIGHQPQNVRVTGVPFDSRFAKTMVDADYYMKRLVNGSVKLDIDGFESLSDLHAAARREQVRGKLNPGDHETSMNRFWFSPGETTYEQQEGAVVLRTCQVKLLTEEEFLNSRGGISGKGRPDPLADRFAWSFTEHYDEIAVQRPIYRQLQGLFAFVAIARLLKADRADRLAPGAFSYFLKAHKVAVVPVSRQVNGLTAVRRIEDAVDTPQGRRTIVMIQSSCGGVSMSVRPKRINSTTAAGSPAATKPAIHVNTPVEPAPSAKTTSAKPGIKPPTKPSLAKAVLSARKSPKSLSWDVEVD